APAETGPRQLRGFLRDCADIAFAAPFAASPALEEIGQLLCSSLDVVLSGRADAALPESILAATLAAACALAANAGLDPGASSGLAGLVAAAEEGCRKAAAGHLQSWRRPLRHTALVPWLALIEQDQQQQQQQEQEQQQQQQQEQQQQQQQQQREQEQQQQQEQEQEEQQLQQEQQEQRRQQPGPSWASGPPPAARAAEDSTLRQLLEGAPTELRCALDGRLLTDPVRTPHSDLVYERAVLGQELARNGGVCPASGLPLSLAECSRDAATRRNALCWTRERQATKAAARQKGALSVVADSARPASSVQATGPCGEEEVSDDEPNYNSIFGQ
ncbi:unnamed protein product, partial [Polarella glacialis]